MWRNRREPQEIQRRTKTREERCKKPEKRNRGS